MRAPAYALVALAFATPASAQRIAQPALEVEIGEAGVIQRADPNPQETPPQGDNLVGTSPQSPAQFVHPGSDVEARFCTSFGFRFRAPNLPPPLGLRVTIVLDHPLWTRPDGRTGTQERFPSMISREWSYSGYSLEESWTLVPGTWRFTVMLGDKQLATQSFELTVPPGQHFDGCAAAVS